MLIGAAVVPAHAASQGARPCGGQRCTAAEGRILWASGLPGSWTARGGADGTVLSHGEAYAAIGSGIAAVGFGREVYGYDARSGKRAWTTALSGLPAGSSVVSVRAWPGVVTVGVDVPGSTARQEVVLSALTGRQLAVFPAAAYGGAVAASRSTVVIIGATHVISYAVRTGRVVWQHRTGTAEQAWRTADGELYVTVAADGYLGTAPVTALRRISLRSGAELMIRPAGRGSFAGTLSGAAGDVVLFSGAAGLTGYSGETGRQLWFRPGVVPQTIDPVRQTLYVTAGSELVGLDPGTGARISGADVRGSSGLYGVRAGVALGLDEGARGVAWGYDILARRVVWTSPAVPWPHYFVDLSGAGGSADPITGAVLLASCGRLGVLLPGQAGRACARPELVAIRR
ncbi:MAG TPA: PQQ-binding-like beta-propeller repeat protein [Streptosporangiaceae bacterium]